MADKWRRRAIEAITQALSDLDFITGDERFNNAIGCAIADMEGQRRRLERELNRQRRRPAPTGQTPNEEPHE